MKNITKLILIVLLAFPTISAIGQPCMPGYVWNGTACVPAGTEKQLYLKVLFQGFQDVYGTPTAMVKCQGDAGDQFTGVITDTCTVELHDSISGYSNIIYAAHGVEIDQDGTAHSTGKTYVSIPSIYTGTYYITIRHRNHIETTSAFTQSFVGATVTYDFTTAINKAYGSNQILLNGKAWIFAGDIYIPLNNPPQDGIVETADIQSIITAIDAFSSGYTNDDLNGDGIVETADYQMVVTATDNFIGAVTP